MNVRIQYLFVFNGLFVIPKESKLLYFSVLRFLRNDKVIAYLALGLKTNNDKTEN